MLHNEGNEYADLLMAETGKLTSNHSGFGAGGAL